MFLTSAYIWRTHFYDPTVNVLAITVINNMAFEVCMDDYNLPSYPQTTENYQTNKQEQIRILVFAWRD